MPAKYTKASILDKPMPKHEGKGKNNIRGLLIWPAIASDPGKEGEWPARGDDPPSHL